MVTVYMLFTVPEVLPHAIGWVTVLLLEFPWFDCLFLSTPRLRKIFTMKTEEKRNNPIAENL